MTQKAELAVSPAIMAGATFGKNEMCEAGEECCIKADVSKYVTRFSCHKCMNGTVKYDSGPVTKKVERSRSLIKTRSQEGTAQREPLETNLDWDTRRRAAAADTIDFF